MLRPGMVAILLVMFGLGLAQLAGDDTPLPRPSVAETDCLAKLDFAASAVADAVDQFTQLRSSDRSRLVAACIPQGVGGAEIACTVYDRTRAGDDEQDLFQVRYRFKNCRYDGTVFAQVTGAPNDAFGRARIDALWSWLSVQRP